MNTNVDCNKLNAVNIIAIIQNKKSLNGTGHGRGCCWGWAKQGVVAGGGHVSGVVAGAGPCDWPCGRECGLGLSSCDPNVPI